VLTPIIVGFACGNSPPFQAFLKVSMAFSSYVLSRFSLFVTSSFPFPLLGSTPLPIYGAHQGQFMIEFGALEIKHGLILGIVREV
jgi:hypothetical protein